MKSRFKEILISINKLNVNLDEILKENTGEINIAYILHDKNDTLSHYHIFLEFGEIAVDNSSVSELFKVPYAFVFTCRVNSWSDLKNYMIHTRDYEYSVNDIVSNFDLNKF